MDDYFYDEEDEYLDSLSEEELEKLHKFLSYIKYLKENLALNTLPTIQCIKHLCLCGICAPKADSITTLDKIMKNYVVSSITFDKS